VLEVESKYRSAGNERLEDKLKELGASKLSSEEMEDSYFRHSSRDFGKTDEALRLRRSGDSAELTYKGPRMESKEIKAREEVTLKVLDPLAAQRIIERLGFEEMMVVRKRRVSYLYDKVRIALDHVEGLGEFVELELVTEDPERAKSLLEEVRSALALKNLERRTYVEMLLEKAE